MPELITMAYVNYWFKHAFESFGWMVLAMKQGNNNKVVVYLESIAHLKDNIVLKISETQNVDTKQDLEIMRAHVETLIKVANKTLKVDNLVGGVKKSSKRSKKH
mgnify:CR=1 FL=1|tara:strand:- start:584 stop:895 length:312 start_codon:yes stop_codon:yes gene_type:complete